MVRVGGSVGETEEELKKRGAKFVKGVNAYKSSAMGMALRADRCDPCRVCAKALGLTRCAGAVGLPSS
jgi:hypothetical protein